MDDRFDNYPFVNEQYDATTTPENVANSPLSGDDTPLTRKRRGLGKRVMTVQMGGGVDGTRIKGEVYPPSDSWAWRKYGQKPIKGSPYPRGYYRCSSSKGCPAKKQVERSYVDPTTVVITYSCDHNHPIPSSTAAKHFTSTVPAKFPPEELAVFANQPDLEPNNEFAEFTGECGWLPDASFTMLETPVIVGTAFVEADVALESTMGEEDESLFADLGELPECSMVFGRSDDHRRLCGGGAVSCGSTG